MAEIETWGQLVDTLVGEGYAEDEYLIPFPGFCYREPGWRELPLWERDTRWIACYWVAGDSEGYYVHVDCVYSEPVGLTQIGYYLQLRLLGKFGRWELAAQCAARAQVLVNGTG